MEITVIPAKAAEVTASAAAPEKKLRVAAYARVSTELEEQENSYEAQCSHYRAYIENHDGWILAGIYSDEGLSSTSTRHREGFQALIADCEQGKVDRVLTKSISRFARNTLDCLENVRKLKALGIPIFFEKENIDTMGASGELLLTIMASIAQQESASISQNTRMGWQYVFQQGRPVLNHTCFLGYTKQRGDARLTPVPEEASVVRRIYRWHLDGMQTGEILFSLRELQIPSPTGRDSWTHSTIHSILQNEKYRGDLLLQKYYVEDYLTKKRVRNAGRYPQYYVENAHAPLVPREIWTLAQEVLRSRKKSAGGNRISWRANPLFGRTFCGLCGAPFQRYANSRNLPSSLWRCRNTCESPAVRESALTDAVVMAFLRLPAQIDPLKNLLAETPETGPESALRRLRIRSLLYLAEALNDPAKKQGTGAENASAGNPPNESRFGTAEPFVPADNGTGAAGVEEPGSCLTPEDFLARTDDLPGREDLSSFHPLSVRRFVESLQVASEGILVRFRAGVEILV